MTTGIVKLQISYRLEWGFILLNGAYSEPLTKFV